jgi:uncharacterized membrane protein YfcA
LAIYLFGPPAMTSAVGNIQFHTLKDLVIFQVQKGFFDASIALPVVIGSLIGGYIGSKYARYKGNKLIKTMFITIGTILAIKLLAGF